MSDICNGYSISDNLATEVGRKYEVSDSNRVLFTTTESKRKALDYAESLPAGEVQPEKESEPVAEEAVAEPVESEE